MGLIPGPQQFLNGTTVHGPRQQFHAARSIFPESRQRLEFRESDPLSAIIEARSRQSLWSATKDNASNLFVPNLRRPTARHSKPRNNYAQHKKGHQNQYIPYHSPDHPYSVSPYIIMNVTFGEELIFRNSKLTVSAQRKPLRSWVLTQAPHQTAGNPITHRSLLHRLELPVPEFLHHLGFDRLTIPNPVLFSFTFPFLIQEKKCQGIIMWDRQKITAYHQKTSPTVRVIFPSRRQS